MAGSALILSDRRGVSERNTLCALEHLNDVPVATWVMPGLGRL